MKIDGDNVFNALAHFKHYGASLIKLVNRMRDVAEPHPDITQFHITKSRTMNVLNSLVKSGLVGKRKSIIDSRVHIFFVNDPSTIVRNKLKQ